MRARNIKPGFFQNEDIAELPPETRLLFIGLSLLADREGRLEDRPKRIKMLIFPADSWDVEPMLAALHNAGLIVRYEVEGHKYIEIPKFLQHQNPHPNEKESVLPPRTEALHTKVVSAPAESLNPDSLNPESLKPENSTAAAPPREPPEFAEFKSIFPRRAGSQPWQNALRAINARLREGHTWTEILDGARRYAAYIRAEGDEGTKHVLQAATFCGTSKRFLEPFDLPASKAERRLAGNLSEIEKARQKVMGNGTA